MFCNTWREKRIFKNDNLCSSNLAQTWTACPFFLHTRCIRMCDPHPRKQHCFVADACFEGLGVTCVNFMDQTELCNIASCYKRTHQGAHSNVKHCHRKQDKDKKLMQCELEYTHEFIFAFPDFLFMVQCLSWGIQWWEKPNCDTFRASDPQTVSFSK